MGAGDAVGPARRHGGQIDRHLQQAEAFVEIDLQIDVHARLAAVETDRPLDPGVAETAIEPGADASGPVSSTRQTPPPASPRPAPPSGRCGTSRCRRCRGADGDRCRLVEQLGCAAANARDAAAAELHGQRAVGKHPGRGLDRAAADRHRWRRSVADVERRAAVAPISAANRRRGIIWCDSGWTSWKATGRPFSSLSQRPPQSSKSR